MAHGTLWYDYGTFILTSKYKIHSEASNHLSIQDIRIFNVEMFLGDLNVNPNEAKLNNNMPVDDFHEIFYNTVKWGNFGPLFVLEGRLQKNHTQYGGETFFKLGAHDVGENIR